MIEIDTWLVEILCILRLFVCFVFAFFCFFLCSRLFVFLKAFLILFATIAGTFCIEPINVEANTKQTIKEAQPEKRSIGLSALNDCDGPLGDVGLHGGLQSGVAVHSDLALGLHGAAYAPAYSGGYLASSGYLSQSVGHVGAAVVGASPVIAGGYAPHAPIFASSVVSHAPVLAHAPTVN